MSEGEVNREPFIPGETSGMRLAGMLDAELQENPKLTSAQLAERTGATELEVVNVLDQYLNTDTRIEFIGPGQGGGWTPQPGPPEPPPATRLPEDVVAQDLQEGLITQEQHDAILSKLQTSRAEAGS